MSFNTVANVLCCGKNNVARKLLKLKCIIRQIVDPVRALMTSPSEALPSMFFRGIGTATPTACYTKADCLEAFQKSDWFARLDARSHFIMNTVLQRDNGIEARRLAVGSLAAVFQ